MSEAGMVKNLPLSLSKVSMCLEKLKPPSRPFDPNGEWEHRYAIWVLYPTAPGSASLLSNATMCRPMGTLRLHRRPLEDGGVELDVSQATLLGARGQFACRVDARISCLADRLTTPRSWEWRSVLLDQAGKPIEGTQAQQSGQIEGAVIRRRGKTERSTPAPKVLTSNWSLFDALQRLPRNLSESLTFDMLEEMDLLKPNQRLTARPGVEAILAGQPTKLHGFVQIGEGILPYEYWFDDERRLLIAVGGMRAYIFDPSAQLPEAKI